MFKLISIKFNDKLSGTILVLMQFLIIFLHFIKWEIFPKKEILPSSIITNIFSYLCLFIGSIIMLLAVKELGRNLSPFPIPKTNSKLTTTGVYSVFRHPMYYSLLFISIGIFFTKLTIYYLGLTIILILIIKSKIILEEYYLNKKFKDYFIYKDKVKY